MSNMDAQRLVQARKQPLGAIVMRGLGGLLLLAAALKIHGLGVEPVGRLGLFSSQEFQLFLVEFEISLPCGSCPGSSPGRMAHGAVGFYRLHWCDFLASLDRTIVLWLFRPAVGASALYARPGFVGARDADCWAARSEAALGESTPDFGERHFARCLRGRRDRRRLSTVGRLAYAAFGSIPTAIAYFRGERVSVEPRFVDVGEGVRGTHAS